MSQWPLLLEIRAWFGAWSEKWEGQTFPRIRQDIEASPWQDGDLIQGVLTQGGKQTKRSFAILVMIISLKGGLLMW
jgi:hypothetical protein